MMQIKHLIGVAGVLALLAAAGCAKSQPKLDFGAVEGSVYRNAYFGLELNIPANWNIQDSEQKKAMMAQGGKLMAGNDKTLQAVYDASALNTVILLSAFKHPVGAAVDSNPNVTLIAEKIAHAPGIRRGSDYLFHARKGMESGQVSMSVRNDVYEKKAGDTTFDVMDVDLKIGKKTVKQMYYATILKGYALSIIISYSSPGELKELEAVLSTLKLQQ